MSSKKIDPSAVPPGVERELHPWGVRLIMKPFRDSGQPVNMEIEAEIQQKQGGRPPQIQVRFSGTQTATMRITDAVIWMEAYKSVLAMARAESATMKEAIKKKAGKKKP